jgi:hypothetical protein
MNLNNGSIDAKPVKDAEPSILTLVSET